MKKKLSEKLKNVWLYITFNLLHMSIKFKVYKWLYFIKCIFSLNNKLDPIINIQNLEITDLNKTLNKLINNPSVILDRKYDN